jgi:hypothetical protein
MASLIVEPAFQEIELGKENQTVEIYYTNKTDIPLLLTLSTKNFTQDNSTGALKIGDSLRTKTQGLASFLSLESSTLILDPGEKKPLKVRIENRESLAVGGSYGSVIATVTSDSRDTMTVLPSIAAFLLVTKQGKIKNNIAVQEGSFDKNVIIFSRPRAETITVKNGGNTHVTPYGTSLLTDMFGRIIGKGTVNTGSLTILPDALRTIPITYNEEQMLLPVSTIKLTVQGNTTKKNNPYTYEHTVLYVAPWFLFIVVCILISTILLWQFLRKK